jgi:O-antigen ligase
MIGKIGRKADELAKWAAVLIGLSLPLSTAMDGILLALMVLLWLLSDDFRFKYKIIRNNPVALGALAMFVISVLGLLYGHVDKGALSDAKTFLMLPLLITLFREERMRRYAWRAFPASMVLTLALSYLSFFHLLPANPFIEIRRNDPGVLILNRITQNFFMAFTAFLLAVQARFAGTRFMQAAFTLLSLLAAVNVMFMIPSRTGQVVLVVLMGFYFFAWLRWRGVIAAGLMIVLVAGVIYGMPGSAVHIRMAQMIQEYGEWQPGHAASMESSAGLRMEFYHNSLKIIRENPLFGVGTGGFAGAYKKQIQNSPMVATDNPHNQYLLTAVELGLVGLGALLIFFAIQWRTAARLLRGPDKMLAYALLLAIITGSLFNSLLTDHTETLFYIWGSGILFAGPAPAPDAESLS